MAQPSLPPFSILTALLTLTPPMTLQYSPETNWASPSPFKMAMPAKTILQIKVWCTRALWRHPFQGARPSWYPLARLQMRLDVMSTPKCRPFLPLSPSRALTRASPGPFFLATPVSNAETTRPPSLASHLLYFLFPPRGSSNGRRWRLGLRTSFCVPSTRQPLQPPLDSS